MNVIICILLFLILVAIDHGLTQIFKVLREISDRLGGKR